jgi:DNA-binding CsgD family transcriptional regulator
VCVGWFTAQVAAGSRDYQALVGELIAQQDDLVVELLIAVGRAVEPQYRDLVVTECLPHLQRLLPACLRCMRDGGHITASDLAPVVLASERRASAGVPASASLAAIRGAIGTFGAIVVRRAGISRAPAVAAVLSQAAIFSHDFAQAVIAGRRPARSPRPAWMENLPSAQRQILHLAARGRSTQQMAQQLHYSEQNVGYHLHQMMQKMQVRNRTALVARAVQHGLVTLTDD